MPNVPAKQTAVLWHPAAVVTQSALRNPVGTSITAAAPRATYLPRGATVHCTDDQEFE